MPVKRLRRLTPAVADRLREAPFNYPEVGATAAKDLPVGYHHLEYRVVLGSGDEFFEDVADALSRWEMQLGAGLGVHASGEVVEPRAVAVLRIGVGPIGVRAPVRVIDLVVEPRLRGFAYGTLPGHPECGEERFLVEHAADGTVSLVLRAFSRPGTAFARVLGPLGRAVQRFVTWRYGRSLRG